MKILAIETSTMLGGIALIDDLSRLFAEIRFNVESTHSERLMIGLDHILKQTSLNISDIDVFAISIGPGSFTGLRIGLSSVKGFSYATGKPIVSVPTLEALAWHFPYAKFPVCPMLDARKKEVYTALFKWNNAEFRQVIDITSIKVEEILEKINVFCNGKIIFTGEGAILYRDKIKKIMGSRAIFPPHDKMIPSPSNIATLGIKKALQGEFSDPISLVPFYLRKSEAEIKHDGRNHNS